MEAYLPTDSNELIISFSPKEVYFAREALCGWMDHARQEKNRLGLTVRDNRKKIERARLLYAGISQKDFSGQLAARVNVRETLQEALFFGLSTVDSALMGEATDDIIEAQDPDRLLYAKDFFGRMLLALEIDVIRAKTDTYNNIEKELAGVTSE